MKDNTDLKSRQFLNWFVYDKHCNISIGKEIYVIGELKDLNL